MVKQLVYSKVSKPYPIWYSSSDARLWWFESRQFTVNTVLVKTVNVNCSRTGSVVTIHS